MGSGAPVLIVLGSVVVGGVVGSLLHLERRLVTLWLLLALAFALGPDGTTYVGLPGGGVARFGAAGRIDTGMIDSPGRRVLRVMGQVEAACQPDQPHVV